MTAESSTQTGMDKQTQAALERAARRMEWMRSVKLRATVAAIVGWVFTSAGLVLFSGPRYRVLGEYAFQLGVVGALIVFAAALWLMVKLEGES